MLNLSVCVKKNARWQIIFCRGRRFFLRSKILRAEFVEHFCVRLHDSEEIFGVKNSERARVRARLGETFQLVPTAQRRV